MVRRVCSEDGQLTHLKIDPSRAQGNYSMIAAVPVNITGCGAGIIVGLRVQGSGVTDGVYTEKGAGEELLLDKL